MPTETWVQTFVHKIEEGGWAKWMRTAVLMAFVAFVLNLWLVRDNGFKGLTAQQAMDQAQVSRELAQGHGFSTRVIRPAALWQFRQNQGEFNVVRTPDTYNAPLNVVLNAPFLLIFRSMWEMSTKSLVFALDRVLVCVQLAYMLLAVWVSYLTFQRLFDHRLAVLVTWLLLLCQTLWNFAISGLPQNLMLLLFMCAIYTLVRALENRTEGKRTVIWLGLCAFCFGLLALTHGLTIWMFAGALVFCGLTFKPRWATLLVMGGVFFLLYAPWLYRNYRVCGNIGGVGSFAYLDQIRGSESYVLRSMQPPLKDVSPWLYRAKIQAEGIRQLGSIYQYLGAVVVAPLFFLALMHLFKRPETSLLRWAILLMWLAALLGMSTIGMDKPVVAGAAGPDVQSNDLHMLFIPVMSAYGLAFILVLWSRLNINVALVRRAFIGLILFISAIPFLVQFVELNSRATNPVRWPPYIPPFISVLADYVNPDEIIVSDMPWAVAWYANRKSLLLPITIKDFTDLNDYNQLKGGLVGLYLTPVTGYKGLINEIEKGEYKDWAAFIKRDLTSATLKDFPLKAATPLPIDRQCIFYSDRDRWTPRED